VSGKESDILAFVLDLLAAHRFLYWRENNVGIYDPVKKVYRTNKHRSKGVADVTVIVRGIYVGIETKGDSGHMSADQRNFRDDVQKAGGAYYLISTREQAMDMLTCWPFVEEKR